MDHGQTGFPLRENPWSDAHTRLDLDDDGLGGFVLGFGQTGCSKCRPSPLDLNLLYTCRCLAAYACRTADMALQLQAAEYGSEPPTC
jgi:hypothetical protein